MFIPKSKWLALIGAALLGAGSVHAQDNKALINALIQKGFLTQDEAGKITDEIRRPKLARRS